MNRQGRPRVKPGVETHNTYVAMPADLRAEAARVAELEDRTLSGIIRFALARYLEVYEREATTAA